MLVLVLNSGSSSLKAAVLEASSGRRRAAGRVERIGEPEPQLRLDGSDNQPVSAADHGAALAALLPLLLARLDGAPIEAVGHRVVHGGERFSQPTRIDDEVLHAIQALVPLAPLHNPPALAGIRAALEALPAIPHVAVFDTAFHASLPPAAHAYALPADLAQRHGLRRYGFHGTSHAWVARKAAHHLQSRLHELRIITCHLGNGCSAAAVEYGRSVDTTMGMTPLEGLVMGTRCGDLDPGLLLALMRREGLDIDQADKLLNERSGLAGLAGVGKDMRDIEAGAAEGDERCRLALQVFDHRLRRHIGGLAAVMGGVDAIVFTGGIGENSALARSRCCQRLDFLGARLDEDRNRDAALSAAQPVAIVSAEHSRVRLLVVATDEAQAIARQTTRLVRDSDKVQGELRIPIAISARHVHLTQPAVEALFGAGHQLTIHKPLRQPGQYAARETVTVLGPKRSLERVRVMGPCRGRCQVEISRTDEFYLGLDAPIRGSGDLDGTPGVVLVGPAGRLALDEGLICARRHIHMAPEHARQLGVQHKDVVDVAVDSQGRDLVFGDVLVRVKEGMVLDMHLDTDEGNAAEISTGAQAALVPTAAFATILKRHTGFDKD